jgi:hypothetical protein
MGDDVAGALVGVEARSMSPVSMARIASRRLRIALSYSIATSLAGDGHPRL